MDVSFPAPIDASITDKYLVERELGSGDVGVVFAAVHRQLKQRVALKFMRPEIASREQAIEGFRLQLQASAGIAGEHVCRLLDASTTDAGIPYLVLDHFEGHDLARELAFRGPPAYSQAVLFLLQACDGLTRGLHTGVVHRNLKPTKLYLAEQPGGARTIKVLDLGYAGAVPSAALKLQAALEGVEIPAGPWLRSIEYLAPEQLDDPRIVDASTNVWAMGAIAYELLCGHPPFLATTAEQFALSLRTAAPTGRTSSVQLPRPLMAAVLRALEPAREHRYPSVVEFARELALFAPVDALANFGDRLRVGASSVSRETVAATAVSADLRRTRRTPAGRSWVWMAGASAALFAGAGFWLSTPPAPPTVELAANSVQPSAPVRSARPSAPAANSVQRQATPTGAVAVSAPAARSVPTAPAPKPLGPKRPHVEAGRSTPKPAVPILESPPRIADFGGRR